MNSSSRSKAFASLHQKGKPLLLPNAWDAGSAVAIASAGAPAIATTSAGVAWSLGVPDAVDLGAERAAAVIRLIAAAVDVPVSADIEAGYDDVAATVRAVAEAGAVGVNIEDRVGGVLLDPRAQADRLYAARRAADQALPGARIWINARTDVYLSGAFDGADAHREAMARSGEYEKAGADSLFVPGLTDLDAIAELSRNGPLPVAVMVWPGAPTVAELTAAGVVRISLGPAIAQAAYAVAARATTEMLAEGTYDACAGGLPYEEFNEAITLRGPG
jgi:2-methylisocitrate lyase-like PEP mutase family enzyme